MMPFSLKVAKATLLPCLKRYLTCLNNQKLPAKEFVIIAF